ncbi:RNA-directed DNA polymerase [Candidatus Moduliflexus flocculans]|uniref:RNA-directed DNA polymerase n=1 Tax=Candidatus Moduliflexus flocculans TaxID=1499966 RepID=A0A0S6W4X5_9BACT|nr:RNA-directed DNA polymerase [Candidatus Moduliflexus flocculans]
MKRCGDLFERIIAFENLLNAAKAAQRGKRFQENVLRFNYRFEQELFALQDELRSKSYQPGDYRTFEIYEPKRRLISAAPYRDRVVHHALCNVVMPIFDRTFIRDSYANRTGFGTHRALRRFVGFFRSSRYILQCDIRKYFPSIDHAILKTLIRRKIKCRETLWLIDTIIDHSNPQEPVTAYFPGDDLLTPFERRHGLPIGNLTSQFFANLYLNGFDHFVKETLFMQKYLRYVDDFALFDDDRERLADAKQRIDAFLATLRLTMHPVKSQLFETRHGANVVGFRVLPDRIRVRTENLRRARRRLRQQQADYTAYRLNRQELTQSLRSWIAHLAHGNTWRLRGQLFARLAFARG